MFHTIISSTFKRDVFFAKDKITEIEKNCTQMEECASILYVHTYVLTYMHTTAYTHYYYTDHRVAFNSIAIFPWKCTNSKVL